MATRFFSKHALNVFTLKLDVWEFPIHNHNFYELIFIVEGAGIHIVNEVSIVYKKNDIFLLTPQDEHGFQISENTVFTFVKFTEQLFLEKSDNFAKGKWQNKIDAVLYNPNANPNSVVKEGLENAKMFILLNILKSEYANTDFFSRHVVLELFGAMITIVARSLSNPSNLHTSNEEDSEKITLMLNYIRQNIFDRDKLTIVALALKFSLSKNYVGMYIKRNTGRSLQYLVLETKFKTAERLLCSSKMQIKEIANKLQFNDISHFSRMFKKHNGNTPSYYRAKNRKLRKTL